MSMPAEGEKLWEPSREMMERSNIRAFMNWLEREKGLQFSGYEPFWKWSVTELEHFWQAVWDYFDIRGKKGGTVLTGREMPGARFFPEAELNYAWHVFRNKNREHPAVICRSEIRPEYEVGWDELEGQTAAVRSYLVSIGVKKGDRVAGYTANIHESLVCFLACASIGAVWSSCAPEFGVESVVDRFQQIGPKVFITIDGYRYGGKTFDRLSAAAKIREAIPTVEKVIVIPYLRENLKDPGIPDAVLWPDLLKAHKEAILRFEQVPFNHPLWILYSSGTTGKPKAIVQGHGGILLEHLKVLAFHLDLKETDRFFWYTTTGWMMWNLLISGLLLGATVLFYDGNPFYPEPDTLWRFAESTDMTVFGTSASYLIACMKEGLNPGKKFFLRRLRCIGSTGSPLPVPAFRWVYEKVKKDVWLVSTSGGTDVCSAFLGGCPLRSVHAGELQARALGAAVRSFDDGGREVTGKIGELVLTEPLPSMPLFFWNDPDGTKLRNSYFDRYPGIWRHGDFIKITSRGSAVIYGRSDATINRGGIRMGTSEIYNALDRIKEVADSLIVDVPLNGGRSYMPLFVVLKEGVPLTDALKEKINAAIREYCSPRHVPDDIFQTADLPKTLNGKKLEVPVKKVLSGVPVEQAVNFGSLANPEAFHYFIEFQKKLQKAAR